MMDVGKNVPGFPGLYMAAVFAAALRYGTRYCMLTPTHRQGYIIINLINGYILIKLIHFSQRFLFYFFS